MRIMGQNSKAILGTRERVNRQDTCLEGSQSGLIPALHMACYVSPGVISYHKVRARTKSITLPCLSQKRENKTQPNNKTEQKKRPTKVILALKYLENGLQEERKKIEYVRKLLLSAGTLRGQGKLQVSSCTWWLNQHDFLLELM